MSKETIQAKPTNGAVVRQWPWLEGYSRGVFSEDAIAAIIVTILLVPQCLAYALLAGLPPQVGIYAAIFPLAFYALFGSSRQLSVGPTAVVSLMTAAAIAALPEGERIVSAAALALLTGIFMLIFGILKFGFIMNFVSRPVVSAYITGAGLLIVISQLKHVFGVQADGQTALDLLTSLNAQLPNYNAMALLIGGGSILALWSVKKYLAYALVRLGFRASKARLAARIAPIFVVLFCLLLSTILNLSERFDLRIVGEIPAGLPSLGLPQLSRPAYKALLVPALIIAVVAFVDSMTIAQTLAARSRRRIDANKEILGLGASNFIAGLSAGYPVNGSLSRSAVNFSAGAQTPIASILTAGFMALTALLLTPYLSALPLATLAALIIVACFSMMEFKNLWRTWIYSRADGLT
ncbi:MAG: SulP family inorganic anion transporter, partial [Maricaulaceae bacterium]